jgi:hypothetical protein
MTDLLKINQTNGYQHNIKSVHPVMRTIDEVNEFPSVFAVIGEEQISAVFEDTNMFDSSLELLLLTHIETPDDTDSEGLFTYEAERWVEDYRKLIGSFDRTTGSTLYNIEGVKNYFISRIEPFYDRNENKQTLLLTITVQYVFVN